MHRDEGRVATLAELDLLAPFEMERRRVDVLIRALDEAGDAGLAAHPEVPYWVAVAAGPGHRQDLRQRALASLNRATALRPDRDDLRQRVEAETAMAATMAADSDRAEGLARAIVDTPVGPGTDPIARARATEALARALLWRGEELGLRAGEEVLRDTIDQYERLGLAQWQGAALIWMGASVHHVRGHLDLAQKVMEEGVALLDPGTVRYAVWVTFLTDLLVDRGRLEEAGPLLERAARVAGRFEDRRAAMFEAYGRARLCAAGGDRGGVRQAVQDVERSSGDWAHDPSGALTLADLAELLDRVGDHEAAQGHLARAVALDPDDEFVLQTTAILQARHGDPVEALASLRALAHQPRVHARLLWRHTLYEAWAALRAGRGGVGELAARALEEVARVGGVEVALAADPFHVVALAPLAARAGSQAASRILAGAEGSTLQLLGSVSLLQDGRQVPVPTGAAGMLLRLLAVHPGGLALESVIDMMWPDGRLEEGRRRLRKALTRLRAACGPVVERRDGSIGLRGVWVDAVAFREAADRALGAGPDDAPLLAVAALALWGGEPLPSDLYEDWASPVRFQLRRRRLGLLDLLVGDALRRERAEEAISLLEEVIDADPFDEQRYVLLARVELARGRRAAALGALERARSAANRLGLPVGEDVHGLLAAIHEA